MRKSLPCNFEKIAPGVWRAVIGEASGKLKTLTDYSQTVPQMDEIAKMADADFPLSGEFTAALADGKLSLHVPIATKGEQIYGLGLNFKSINQRGKVLFLKTDHYTGVDSGRTHAVCPVYFTNKGYGVFINSAAYITAYCATSAVKSAEALDRARDRNNERHLWSSGTTTDKVDFYVDDSAAEVIIFAGDSLKSSIAKYNLFCGGGFLPPKWALGFWYRFASLKSQADVMAETDEFLEKGINIDVLGLEPGWMSRSYPCTYEWDPVRFPDPATMTKELLDKGTRLNLWENPYISNKAGIFEAMYPLSADRIVWNGLVPDYTMPEARKILKDQHVRDHADIGISGYKLDECDGYDKWLWPDFAEFPSGEKASTLRQIYGVIWQSLMTEIFAEKNRRTMGLVRASNSGGGKYPFAIYNDKYDFNEYMTGLCNAGFIGVSFTPEVRQARDADEWLKRFQMLTFSPLMLLNSWSSGKKPWSFPEVEKEVSELIALRRSLVPYLYNAFADYHYKGIPPFRAFGIDYPNYKVPEPKPGVVEVDDVKNPYAEISKREINDQLFIGDCLMAAFVRPGETSRLVILPNCQWYNFYTGELAGKDEIVNTDCFEGKTPLYVRSGGMIPVQLECGTIEIRCYGDSGESELYCDDGETLDYLKNAFVRMKMSFGLTEDGGFTHKCDYYNIGKEFGIDENTLKFVKMG